MLITIELNKRTKMCLLWIGGKLVKQWLCKVPHNCPDLPHTLIWDSMKLQFFYVATDTQETFDLKVNNDCLSVLKYLDSGFQLSNACVSVFDANTIINGALVTKGDHTFEHLPGVLMHKILE